MKILFSTLLLTLCMCQLAYTQNTKVTVFNALGDTLEGEMEVPTAFSWKRKGEKKIDYISLQKGIVLIDQEGVKHRIKPDKYQTIEFNYGQEDIKIVSLKKTAKMGSLFSSAIKPYVFLKEELSGILNLYVYYNYQSNSSYNPGTGMTMNYGNHIVEQKYVMKYGELYYIRPLGFKRKMSMLCSDNPILLEKIQNNVYRKSDLEAIIKEYNGKTDSQDVSLETDSVYVANRSVKVAINTLYGTYSMNSMKRFQSNLYDDVAGAIAVPFKITDNFPGFIGYEINVAVALDGLEYGVQLATRSTGGRIAYSDYSGYYTIDNYLRNFEVSAVLGYQIVKKEQFSFLIGATAGLAFTNHVYSSEIQINDERPQGESLNFSSINAVLGPSLKLRYYPIKLLFVEFTGRYDLHIPGKLYFKDNKESYLLDNNSREVTANWSGLRAGIGIGIKF